MGGPSVAGPSVGRVAVAPHTLGPTRGSVGLVLIGRRRHLQQHYYQEQQQQQQRGRGLVPRGLFYPIPTFSPPLSRSRRVTYAARTRIMRLLFSSQALPNASLTAEVAVGEAWASQSRTLLRTSIRRDSQSSSPHPSPHRSCNSSPRPLSHTFTKSWQTTPPPTHCAFPAASPLGACASPIFSPALPGWPIRAGLMGGGAEGASWGSARDSISEGGDGTRARRRRRARPVEARAGASDEAAPPAADQTLKIVSAAALTILLGVSNRVLYKMALVPLKRFPFFLAQITTFGYVLVYFSILWARVQAGIVPRDTITAVPKLPFAAMGALEALGLATGMAAAAVLPGAMITVLSQTFLVWQLILSSLILGRRYNLWQIVGCLLVIAGVVFVVLSSSGPSAAAAVSAFGSTGLVWPLVFLLSVAFPGGSSIIKESVFSSYGKRFNGKSLDIFVVNSFGSAFQALFVFLLLPVLSQVALQIPLTQLPSYLAEGTGCLLNLGGSISSECNGAPLLPLMYIATNLMFNISLLRLLKISSAVVTSLCASLSVPLTIAAFTLPLPLLGQPQHLGPGFIVGTLLLLAGLASYNFLGRTSVPSTASQTTSKAD